MTRACGGGPHCTDVGLPVLTCPNLTHSTDMNSSVATFNLSATVSGFDAIDGVLSPSCNVTQDEDGHQFSFGATSVVCSATDAAGNIGTCAFTVNVSGTLCLECVNG